MLKISEIGYDPKYYPRVNGKENWLTVHQYTDAVKSGATFDPIVVSRVVGRDYKYIILDGLHRLKAYYGAGKKTIPGVIESLPESKWFARSVELNSRHGRQLDPGDKAWVAARLECDGYSMSQIAKLLQMTPESIEKLKASRIVKVTGQATKLGRGNREVGNDRLGFLKAPFTDHSGTAAAEGVLSIQESVSSRTIISVLDQMIAVLRSGLDLSDRQVAERVDLIRSLI